MYKVNLRPQVYLPIKTVFDQVSRSIVRYVKLEMGLRKLSESKYFKFLTVFFYPEMIVYVRWLQYLYLQCLIGFD